MNKTLDEFRNRRSFVTNMNFKESKSRLSGFVDWLDTNEATATIMSGIENNDKVIEILKKSSYQTPPQTSSLEEVVQIGLYFLRQVKAGKEIFWFSNAYGIRPSFQTKSVQLLHDEVVNRYIEPAINYIEGKIIEKLELPEDTLGIPSSVMNVLSGDFRGAILNIGSTLTKTSQIIQDTQRADDNVKEELVKSLEELKEILSETPPEKADSAEAVAWAAETLIEAKTSEKTNPVKIEITKDGLMKAARNIASVMPTVLPIAEKIISFIDKIS